MVLHAEYYLTMKEINILILNDTPDCYNKNKNELEKNTHNTTSFRVKYLHVMGIIYVYHISEEVGKLWASGTFIFPFFEL